MQHSESTNLPHMVMLTSGIALLCLILLHFVSPEFEPNWRMVSEYATGDYKWLITLFFICWGFSAAALAVSLRSQVTSKSSKAGVVLLFISGLGATLAALFDVTQPTGHGIAGLLGIPTLPIATLLISYHMSKKKEWFAQARPMKLLAHGTWITLVLMILSMMMMMSGFQNAGIEMGPDSPPPDRLPEGVIAFTGYINRLLILVDISWLLITAKALKSISIYNTVISKA